MNKQITKAVELISLPKHSARIFHKIIKAIPGGSDNTIIDNSPFNNPISVSRDYSIRNDEGVNVDMYSLTALDDENKADPAMTFFVVNKNVYAATWHNDYFNMSFEGVYISAGRFKVKPLLQEKIAFIAIDWLENINKQQAILY